jgi:tetratricopeptide (TPR) repeat protein
MEAETEYEKLLRENSVLEPLHTIPKVDEFLGRFPNFPKALRLRGLLTDACISLEISKGNSVSPKDERHKLALKYYQKALSADPDFTLVLIDLGDYWLDRSKPEVAMNYYNRAVVLLQSGHFTDSLDEEMKSALDGKRRALETKRELAS